MRIGIVNDSALARESLRRAVALDLDCTIAWFAADGAEAVGKAAIDPPDVVLMDLFMPVMDGVESTRRIMKANPCSIVIVTGSVTENFGMVCRAMGAGALDAVDTPLGSGIPSSRTEALLARLARLKGIRRPIAVPAPPPYVSTTDHLPPVVAIGCSTGGPDALVRILSNLPARFPAAIVIAQHIGLSYAASLAEWLGKRCAFAVRVAREGDCLEPGIATLAATDDHMVFADDRTLRYTSTPHDYPYRPSVDVLFQSLAARGPKRGIGVILTGMGSDGARGMALLGSKGWHTIAQDEATSIVFGMPQAAIQHHSVCEVLALDAIGPRIRLDIDAFIN